MPLTFELLGPITNKTPLFSQSESQTAAAWRSLKKFLCLCTKKALTGRTGRRYSSHIVEEKRNQNHPQEAANPPGFFFWGLREPGKQEEKNAPRSQTAACWSRWKANLIIYLHRMSTLQAPLLHRLWMERVWSSKISVEEWWAAGSRLSTSLRSFLTHQEF